MNYLDNGMVFQVVGPFLSMRAYITLENVSLSIRKKVRNVYRSVEAAHASHHTWLQLDTAARFMRPERRERILGKEENYRKLHAAAFVFCVFNNTLETLDYRTPFSVAKEYSIYLSPKWDSLSSNLSEHMQFLIDRGCCNNLSLEDEAYRYIIKFSVTEEEFDKALNDSKDEEVTQLLLATRRYAARRQVNCVIS